MNARAPSGCKLEKGELKLSASSTETGESEDSLETDYNGEALTIGFNAQYHSGLPEGGTAPAM